MLSEISQSREKSKYSGKVIKKWTPSLFPPQSGQITSSINRLTQDFLEEIFNPNNRDIHGYITMAKKDPTVRACIELKCLRVATALGKYHHPNNKREEWINQNFENMKGSIKQKVGRLGSAAPLGFSVAEIVFSSSSPGFKNQWKLKDLIILDPTRVSFEGTREAGIKYVVYNDGSGVSKRIPYSKCIHVSNGFGSVFGTDDDVFGDPESKTAYQYYKAKQAILAEMMVAAKANAGGIFIGKADGNVSVEMLDPLGQVRRDATGAPMTEPAQANLYRQLLNLENNSVVVTDKDNEISTLASQTSEGFWSIAIDLLDKGIKRSYGIPDLIFSEGSSAIQFGSLGKQHKSILDAQVESILVQIQDQILEKIVKPLLVFNFGEHDLGSFASDPVLDPDTQSSRVNNIISAMSSNIISPSNTGALNTLSELLGLPSLTESQRLTLIQNDLIKTYIENQVFAGDTAALGLLQEATKVV
jgi:hypothetical protein